MTSRGSERHGGFPSKDMAMDNDRTEGSAKQAKGSIKEALGNLTGDGKLQAEGQGDKLAGKTQNAVGGLKDTVRDALDGKKNP